MPVLPHISGEETAKAFQRDGWILVRQRGSHMIMVKDGHIASLSIPHHKEVARGTLRALIRNAGLTVHDFLQLL
ncbi:MAG: type II toxin-antitoxin system HicA family toxin [Kiritimatiellae bacterium]|nr:type II toxin-antitoxin system HicA family toxin [Kiritimatiellia bacterium]